MIPRVQSERGLGLGYSVTWENWWLQWHPAAHGLGCGMAVAHRTTKLLSAQWECWVWLPTYIRSFRTTASTVAAQMTILYFTEVV